MKNLAAEEPSFPDTRAGAVAAMQYLANHEVNAVLLSYTLAGDGQWRADPYVPNVWGFHSYTDSSNTVRAVVYLAENDFELDDEWFDLHAVDLPSA